jgi:ATPase subunit of ABC transporter with duplicated ATPase domains
VVADFAVVMSHDSLVLDRTCTHMLVCEGEGHVEWFEGNFEDYEADKGRRLGPDAVELKRFKYKKFARYGEKWCRSTTSQSSTRTKQSGRTGFFTSL